MTVPRFIEGFAIVITCTRSSFGSNICHFNDGVLTLSDCSFTGPKKSVSFSEEVRFHSPHASPHQSPRKAKLLPGYCDQHSLVARHPLSKDLLRGRPKSLPQGMLTCNDLTRFKLLKSIIQ